MVEILNDFEGLLALIKQLLDKIDKKVSNTVNIQECFMAIPAYEEMLSFAKSNTSLIDAEFEGVMASTSVVLKTVINEIYTLQPELRE